MGIYEGALARGMFKVASGMVGGSGNICVGRLMEGKMGGSTYATTTVASGDNSRHDAVRCALVPLSGLSCELVGA